MAYKLDGQALYVPQGDTLRIKLYLQSDSDGKLYPDQVHNLRIEVRSGEVVLKSRVLTRRFACSDGAVCKCDWVGPTQTQNLNVKATATLVDGTTVLSAILPVTLDTSGEATTTALTPQPQVPNQSYGLVNTAS